MKVIGWFFAGILLLMLLSKSCVNSGGVPVLPERMRQQETPTTVAEPPKAEAGGVPKLGDPLVPALPGVGPVGPALPPAVAGALKP